MIVADEDKDLLAPSRQDAKFGIAFFDLGAFASLREIFRLPVAVLPRWDLGSWMTVCLPR